MSRTKLIVQYRKILAEARSVEIAKAEILASVNTLVWVEPGKPNRSLTRHEKFQIIEEIFEDLDFQKSLPSLESERVYGSINEADNSGILDVISALKRGVKD
jgi:hypothetical protein